MKKIKKLVLSFALISSILCCASCIPIEDELYSWEEWMPDHRFSYSESITKTAKALMYHGEHVWCNTIGQCYSYYKLSYRYFKCHGKECTADRAVRHDLALSLIGRDRGLPDAVEVRNLVDWPF